MHCYSTNSLVEASARTSKCLTARKAQNSQSCQGPGPLKSRKERALNSILMEILDMVATKKQEFLEDIEVEDAKELIFPEQTKWGKIDAVVNEAGKLQGGHVERDGLACKYKWQTLLADYKNVVDFHKGTGLVGTEYFDLHSKERKERRLSPQFFEEVYAQMHEWLQYKPIIQPPTPGICSTH